LDPATEEALEDEELEGEGWLDLGGGLYSYGDVAGYEWAEHQFDIALNDLGEAWLESLKVMEAAEILVVGDAEGWVSVAPWHARDLEGDARLGGARIRPICAPSTMSASGAPDPD
jgi:hypothetical protein